MTGPTTQPIKIDGYHAHVYYDPTTRARAAQLRETIASALGVEVRELSDAPRGPHPVPQFRFMFTTAQFENIVAVAHAQRPGPRRSHPPADRQLLRRPLALRGVARHSGAAKAKPDEPHLPRRAISDIGLSVPRSDWIAPPTRGWQQSPELLLVCT